MKDFKEFEEKTLDEAIRAACKFFDATREKLEIELVQDAKNGIFGLVGARQALIRARLAQMQSSVDELRHKTSSGKAVKNKKTSQVNRQPKNQLEQPGHTESTSQKPSKNAIKQIDKEEVQNPSEKKSFVSQDTEIPMGGAHQRRKPLKSTKAHGNISDMDNQSAVVDMQEGLLDESEFGHDVISITSLDQEKLLHEAKEIARNLVIPIVGEVPIDVTVFDNRIDVHVDCGDYSGLMIGRGGQTLASLQYLSSRIISRITGCAIRVQFDIGDYREKQNERLRELALSLAERVRHSGRSCSTRPMSSYHRRIIHLALQECSDIQTRSAGDGVLKRIIIQRRRQERH